MHDEVDGNLERVLQDLEIKRIVKNCDSLYLVLAAPGHDDVGVRHGGRDVVVEGGFHVAGILWARMGIFKNDPNPNAINIKL